MRYSVRMDTLSLGVIELVGPPQVAKRLNIARSSAFRLMRAGLAGDLYTFVQYEMVECELVDLLADRRPMVDLAGLPPALIVRAGSPQRDISKDPRPWYGWHDKYKEDSVKFGISRWWEIREPHKLAGQLFVVTVSGFTVHVARLGENPRPSDIEPTWELDLTEPAAAAADADAWRDIRVKTPGGGAILRHGLD
jgi:hypothetical protein